MRDEATWKAADVTAAVEDIMNQGSGELWRPWEIDMTAISAAVGAKTNLPGHLRKLLEDQVTRSLNRLAEQGKLIKYKQGAHLPWAKPGTKIHYPCYFTPAAHERVKAAGEEEERQRTGYVQWRERLMEKLIRDFGIPAKLEFYGGGDPDKASVCIDVEGWQKLMRLAGQGQEYAALADEWDRRATAREWGAAGLSTAAAELRKLLDDLRR